MNDIDQWFDRTARRETNTVSLYSCLVTGKVFAYFRYRLRYALVLDATRFVIHVAEFLIILTSLGGLAAFTVMILRVGSLIAGGAWWGLLEVMRERIRAFVESGQRDAAEKEIGSWLILSVLVAIIVTVAGNVVLVVMLPSTHDPAGRLYAFLVVIELAMSIPVRTLHSGLFATRRIYRPLWSIFVPTVVQLLVVGLGVSFYPTAAIAVALVVSNAIGIWITVRYTRESYRLTGLTPKFRVAGRPFWQTLPSIPPGIGVEVTLAGLGLRLDAVAVLAIVGIYGTSTRAFDLTAGLSVWRDIDAFQFFYLALPLFRGSYEATGIFYFDFVRLRRLAALRQFRQLFFHRLLWTAPIVTLFFWALALALGLFVLPDVPLSFLVALLPLFTVRSLIGAYQFRLFAEGRFRVLNATFVLSIGLFALVWIDVNPASDLVQITAAMIALLIVHINLQHIQDRTASLPTLLALGDWLHALAQEPDPVRVTSVVIPDWIPSRQRSSVVALLKEMLNGTGHLAFRSPHSLLNFERVTPGDNRDRTSLAIQAATGGAANRAATIGPLATGRDAIDRLVTAGWLASSAGPGAGAESLKATFRALFTDGVVADLFTHEGQRDLRGFEPSLLAVVLPMSIKSLGEGVGVIRVSERWLTPVFDRGRLRVIFVLPVDVDPSQLQNWVQLVKAWQQGIPLEEVTHVRTP
ncbi:MAG: hypothetical protein ACSLE6_06980 [Mycobacterium sp.]